MSWFEAAIRLPISVKQVAPHGYELNTDLLKRMRTGARGKLSVSHDLAEQIGSHTDVIYTDCWPSDRDISEIRSLFLPYQINTDCTGSHCLDTVLQLRLPFGWHKPGELRGVT